MHWAGWPFGSLFCLDLVPYRNKRSTKRSTHSILKQFFSMEPSKANTVGIVKNSPSPRTTRKTLKFFRACSGLFFPQNAEDNKPNYPLLLELPYLRIKPKTQSQQGKKWYPIWGSRSSAVLTYLAHTCIWIIPTPPPHPPPHVSRGKQKWIGTTNARLFMSFLLLTGAFMSFIKAILVSHVIN